MHISTLIERTSYIRRRNNKEEVVKASRKIYVLKCDNCLTEFTRSSKQMKSSRANNFVTHVCENCDTKRFAQTRSTISRRINSYDASSNITIDSLFNNRR